MRSTRRCSVCSGTSPSCRQSFRFVYSNRADHAVTTALSSRTGEPPATVSSTREATRVSAQKYPCCASGRTVPSGAQTNTSSSAEIVRCGWPTRTSVAGAGSVLDNGGVHDPARYTTTGGAPATGSTTRVPARETASGALPPVALVGGKVGGRFEPLPQRFERRRQATELAEVRPGEPPEHGVAVRRRPHAHQPTVGGVGHAAHETGGDGAVDQLDDAVVAEQEVLREVADGRPATVIVPAHGQEELVLGARKAGGGGLLLTPSLEAPQPGPELQEPCVALVGERLPPTSRRLGHAAMMPDPDTADRRSGLSAFDRGTICIMSRRLFVEAFVGARRGLFPWVIATGVIGGLVGAAFVAALNLLERALWPTRTSTGAHFFILAGVGAAVGVLTHVLGTPGDVELL